jgi:hypothetical protein
VSQYIEDGGVTKCREITIKVAEKVQQTLTDLEAAQSALAGRDASPPSY